MDNIFVKKVSFTKTNDKNLPYKDLYFGWTGHEFECIEDYAENKYNNCNALELVNTYYKNNSLYTKTIIYEKIESDKIINKTITVYCDTERVEPDENEYFYNEVYDENIIIGLYEKDNTGNYNFIKDSSCNMKDNKFIIWDIQQYEPDTTIFEEALLLNDNKM